MNAINTDVMDYGSTRKKVKKQLNFFSWLLAGLSWQIFNPMAWYRGIYTWYMGESDAKVMYASRNSELAIVPFLDSLEQKYVRVDNYVFLQYNDALSEKLRNLKFLDSAVVFTHVKCYKTMAALTEPLDALAWYQPDYNIELHLIHQNHWEPVRLAGLAISAVGKSKAEEKIHDFIKVVNVLRNDKG